MPSTKYNICRPFFPYSTSSSRSFTLKNPWINGSHGVDLAWDKPYLTCCLLELFSISWSWIAQFKEGLKAIAMISSLFISLLNHVPYSCRTEYHDNGKQILLCQNLDLRISPFQPSHEFWLIILRSHRKCRFHDLELDSHQKRLNEIIISPTARFMASVLLHQTFAFPRLNGIRTRTVLCTEEMIELMDTFCSPPHLLATAILPRPQSL